MASLRGKKTKLVAKTGKTAMGNPCQCGVDVDEIPKFVDAEYWLQYFPPRGQNDLTRFGLHTDWRRSFITTSTNPYYDSFIRWQFNTLRKNQVIGFGNRPTIYSIEQGQACADHARSEGEGKNPQEYTLIKLRVLDNDLLCANTGIDGLNEALEGRVVYLVAATLRPETMYGQTNCFVLPSGDYGAYAMKDNEVYVCSARALSQKHGLPGHDRGARGFPTWWFTFQGREALFGSSFESPQCDIRKGLHTSSFVYQYGERDGRSHVCTIRCPR